MYQLFKIIKKMRFITNQPLTNSDGVINQPMFLLFFHPIPQTKICRWLSSDAAWCNFHCHLQGFSTCDVDDRRREIMIDAGNMVEIYAWRKQAKIAKLNPPRCWKYVGYPSIKHRVWIMQLGDMWDMFYGIYANASMICLGLKLWHIIIEAFWAYSWFWFVDFV